MKAKLLGITLAMTLGVTAYAQHHHGHASPPAPMQGQGISPDQMSQMKSMMGMMQKMMPMMQKMQQAGSTPEQRAEMMRQMAPMMQNMMPMMQGMMNGSHTGHGAASTNPTAPHVRAYAEAMDRMHDPMNAGVAASDPDEGFVRGMIPHHQGAIDMAKIVLQYGKDEQVRKWANDVIREQQREIGEMEAWLKKNAK